jgi:hypothetical protein
MRLRRCHAHRVGLSAHVARAVQHVNAAHSDISARSRCGRRAISAITAGAASSRPACWPACVTGWMMTTDAYWGGIGRGRARRPTRRLPVVLHVIGVLVAGFEPARTGDGDDHGRARCSGPGHRHDEWRLFGTLVAAQTGNKWFTIS